MIDFYRETFIELNLIKHEIHQVLSHFAALMFRCLGDEESDSLELIGATPPPPL